jgi:hypothetical protein
MAPAPSRTTSDGRGQSAKTTDPNVAERSRQNSPKRTQGRATSAPAPERTATKATENRRAGAAPTKSEKGGKASASGSRSTTGSKKISIEDEFLIEGRLEKPSAYYILRRSRAEYDWARLDAKFLPLVLESVQDPLF